MSFSASFTGLGHVGSGCSAKPSRTGFLLITTIADLAIMTFSTNEPPRPCETHGDAIGHAICGAPPAVFCYSFIQPLVPHHSFRTISSSLSRFTPPLTDWDGGGDMVCIGSTQREVLYETGIFRLPPMVVDVTYQEETVEPYLWETNPRGVTDCWIAKHTIRRRMLSFKLH